MGNGDVRDIGDRLLRSHGVDDFLLHRPSRDHHYDYHYRYYFNIFNNLDLNHRLDCGLDSVHEPVLGQLLRRPSELRYRWDDQSEPFITRQRVH